MKHQTSVFKLLSFIALSLNLVSSAESPLKQFSIPNPTKGVLELSALCNLKRSNTAPSAKQILDAIFADSKKTNRPVLVRFVTQNCPLCHSSTALYKNVAKKLETKAILVNIPYEEFLELGREFAVTKAPTYIVFNRGVPMWRHQGAISESNLSNQVTKYTTN